MREQGVVRRAGIEKRAAPEVTAAATRIEIWIQPIEQARPPLRLRLAETKQPQRRLFEQVVAEEQLVRSLPCEDDLDVVLAREPGEQIHRGGSSAHERRLGVTHDLRKDCGDLMGTDGLDVVTALELPSHELLKLPFIESRIVECDRKRP